MKFKILTSSAIALLMLGSMNVASANKFDGYAEDGRGSVARNSSGECWHTGKYKTSMAISGCDLHDDDKDGVSNDKDKCPKTPAGMSVNASGCETDRDGDGVVDSHDQCPNTAAGAAVNAKGCHVHAPKPMVTDVHVGPVHFGNNSAALDDYAKSTIDAQVDQLTGDNIKHVVVTGHTDNRGSDAYNTALAQRRADAVMHYLASKGVDASKIETVTKGEAEPTMGNLSTTGRARNRRATIHGF